MLMKNINIFFNKEGLFSDIDLRETIIYSKEEDYYILYNSLQDALNNGLKRNFYTTNFKIFNWLKFLRDLYSTQINLEEIFIDETDENIEIPFSMIKPNMFKASEIKAWKDFLLQKYFPYKNYLDLKDIDDKEVNEIILAFSDFYYNSYKEIKNSKYFNSKSLQNIDSKDDISIILLIDNFNYFYASYFSTLLKKEKINIALEDYYFTTIPSITSYGKQALLSMSSYNFSEKWQPSALKELKMKFSEKNVFYLDKIKELKDTIKINHKGIFVVNYLMIDEELHKDDRKALTSTRAKVVQELEEIVLLIKELLESSLKMGIYVATDHGSIKVSGNKTKTENSILKKLTKNRKEKYFELSDEDIKIHKETLLNYGYILDKINFQTPYNIFIPKEGIYFDDFTTEKYFHGGLSPDEIVTPFFKIKNY